MGRSRRNKQLGLEWSQTLGFWYRKKYGLTPNDARFLDITPDEIEADYYAHLYFDNPNAANAVEDEEFDEQSIIDQMANGEDWELISGGD